MLREQAVAAMVALAARRTKSPASLRSWLAGALSAGINTGAPQNRLAQAHAEPVRSFANSPHESVLAYRASSVADLAPGLHDRPHASHATWDPRLAKLQRIK